jgi:hypothetical protein
MRVNVYAEEMTGKVSFVEKEIQGVTYVGVRFHLYLPVTTPTGNVQGPFIHRDKNPQTGADIEADDDSAAVTFWGKRTLKETLKEALRMLETHYPAATATDVLATSSKRDELPYETYERVVGKSWPGGTSAEVIDLLNHYGIPNIPGGWEANTRLQECLIRETTRRWR